MRCTATKMLGLLVLGVGAACGPERPPATGGPGTPAAAPMAAPGERLVDPPSNGRLGEQPCSDDDECALVPRFGCCGDCPPTLPFEAMTMAAIAASQKAMGDQCAIEDHDCSRHRCHPLPPGCSARALCHDGHCRAAVTAGCPE